MLYRRILDLATLAFDAVPRAFFENAARKRVSEAVGWTSGTREVAQLVPGARRVGAIVPGTRCKRRYSRAKNLFSTTRSGQKQTYAPQTSVPQTSCLGPSHP